MRLARFVLPCLLALLSGGCFLEKKKPVVPVPPAPVPTAAPQPATPQPATPNTTTPQPVAVPAPQPPRPRPVPATPTPTPVVPAPIPAPTPAPTLGAILTTDQRTKLDAAYQADLRQANALLNGLAGRTLTSDQTDTVNRARSFIRQAGQFHDRDLTTAAELARRARVLAQDLAGALK